MTRDELIEKMRTANRGMLDRHDLGVILDAILAAIEDTIRADERAKCIAGVTDWIEACKTL